MALNGVISTYDPRKRCGYIKEYKSSSSYYFGKASILDDTLQLQPNTCVKFDALLCEDNRLVAVRISAIVTEENKSVISNHVSAVVLHFDEKKRFGFVRCETNPPIEAFLHQSEIIKSGLKTVRPHQKIKVRLEASGKKLMNAIDVKVTEKQLGFTRSELQQAVLSHGRTDTKQSCSTKPGIRDVAANKGGDKTCQNLRSLNPDTTKSQNQTEKLCKTQSHSKMASVHLKKPAYIQPNASCLTQSYKQTSNLQHCEPQSLSKTVVSPSISAGNMTKYSLEQMSLHKLIEQKRGLLRTLDIKKLPDGGQRIKDQITSLEVELQSLSISKPHDRKDSSTEQNALPSFKEHQPNDMQKAGGTQLIDLTKESKPSYDASLYKSKATSGFSKEHFYGGRMTTSRLGKVVEITGEAIKKLHTSLDTCPPSSDELPDPDGLKVTLMIHQRQALAWLVWRENQAVSGGILADDMGLGKTLTMISLILKQNQSAAPLENGDIEKNSTEVKPEINGADDQFSGVQSHATLIVAPASLIFHWECEINNRCSKNLLDVYLFHGPDREKNAKKLSRFDVVITTYDLVRRSFTNFKASNSKTDPTAKKQDDVIFHIRWRRIILDEAHQIRNYKSQTSHAACGLSARSKWAMSGTPVQNQQADMYAMLKFLHCHPFDEYKLWKHQVDNKTEIGRQRLKSLVSCFVLRREKNQKGPDGKPLVPLPSRSFVVHELKLRSTEQEVYNKLQSDSQTAYKRYEKWRRDKELGKSDVDTDSKPINATTLIVMLLRLRQCCGHLNLLQNKFDPEVLEKEKQDVALDDLMQSLSIANGPSPATSFSIGKYSSEDKAKQFDATAPSSKLTFVLDTLREISVEHPEDKCVVISQWTTMLRVLALHLEKAGYTYAIIEGSVPAKKRMELVEKFNANKDELRVMLVSLQAGGVGLNLIGGNHLFMLDMHWNPALEKQAFDRIYRVGQKKDVFVHKFVMKDTVEEKILKLQERKLAIAKSVMEGAGSESKMKLTLTDMRLLFETR